MYITENSGIDDGFYASAQPTTCRTTTNWPSSNFSFNILEAKISSGEKPCQRQRLHAMFQPSGVPQIQCSDAKSSHQFMMKTAIASEVLHTNSTMR
jgi:hypothetical protein